MATTIRRRAGACPPPLVRLANRRASRYGRAPRPNGVLVPARAPRARKTGADQVPVAQSLAARTTIRQCARVVRPRRARNPPGTPRPAAAGTSTDIGAGLAPARGRRGRYYLTPECEWLT